MSKVHDLKISPEYFDPLRHGLKTFEIRKNDRDFKVGDTLWLMEYEEGSFTGNVVRVVVTYMTDYAQQEGYVVMGILLDD